MLARPAMNYIDPVAIVDPPDFKVVSPTVRPGQNLI
jgi:hypothetical protein